MLFFLYISNNSLQEIESVDDGLGLETYMGRLQIENRRQQEENGEDPKKEKSALVLPLLNKCKVNQAKNGSFSSISHPQDQIIGNPCSGVRTRSPLRNICNNLAFISQVEPKNVNNALDNEN